MGTYGRGPGTLMARARAPMGHMCPRWGPYRALWAQAKTLVYSYGPYGLRPGSLQSEGWTDSRMEGRLNWTDGRLDGRTDGWTFGKLCHIICEGKVGKHKNFQSMITSLWKLYQVVFVLSTCWSEGLSLRDVLSLGAWRMLWETNTPPPSPSSLS